MPYGPGDPEWSLLSVEKVVVQTAQAEQLVFLRQVGGEIRFPIAVGLYEAAAVKHALDNPISARPLTHELVIDVIRLLNAKPLYALIDGLLGGVFYAKLALAAEDGATKELDCRPSDAICVAQQAGLPLFATKEVLEKVSTAAP